MGSIIFWLLLAMAVIVLDLSTSTFLFCWFAIGAFAAIIAVMLKFSFATQLVVFGIVSLISISIGYPWAKKKFKQMTKKIPLMEETYIGKVFVAEEDIINTFRFKVSGIYWTGENEGTVIKKGQKFRIIGIDGNKLKVKALGEE